MSTSSAHHSQTQNTPPNAAAWIRTSQKGNEHINSQLEPLKALIQAYGMRHDAIYLLEGVSGNAVTLDLSSQRSFETVRQQLQEALGVTVQVVYQSVLKHPETARMLRDVRVGNIQCLMATSPTRLARDKSTLRLIVQTLAAYNVRLVTLDGHDTGTPEGKQWLFEFIGQEAN